MTLDKSTPATLFEIRSPRWNGGQKIVGLAEFRITRHNEIRFSYRRRSDGQLSIPESYYFDGNLLKQLDFERQNITGLSLVLIPFNNLEPLERI